MNDDQPDWCLQTRLVHAGERAPAPGSTPTATPIYTSATYLHPDLAALDTALESGSGYVLHLQETFSDVVKTDKTGLSKTAHTRWMISAFANFLPGSTIFRLA